MANFPSEKKEPAIRIKLIMIQICVLEVGAFFQGSVSVDLDADGSLANRPILREALEREIGEIDDEITFDDL